MMNKLTRLERKLLDRIDELDGVYAEEVSSNQKPSLEKLVERGLLERKLDETEDYLYTFTTKGFNAWLGAMTK